MDYSLLLNELLKGLNNFTLGHAIMILVGGVLIGLAVVKKYEPVLLLPIGFGCILANIPLTGMNEEGGLFAVLYKAGISTELFPLLIFVGVGAMIDFSPLLSQPKMVVLGAAGQFGIFGTLLLATALGFPLNEAASIGVIGAIDGPTSIFVASKLAPELLAPIAVAAYSYMSLVPIIQPPLMRLLTTKKERQIRMTYAPRPITKRTRILFPIIVTLVVGLLVPDATPLISMLMMGNLLRDRASFNFRDMNGVALNTGFKQLNGSLSLNQKAMNDELSIGLNMILTNRDSRFGFPEAFRYASLTNPTSKVYLENGNYNDPTGFDVFNPVSIVNQINDGKRTELLTNITASYEILTGLKLTGTYARQTSNRLNGEYLCKKFCL